MPSSTVDGRDQAARRQGVARIARSTGPPTRAKVSVAVTDAAGAAGGERSDALGRRLRRAVAHRLPRAGRRCARSTSDKALQVMNEDSRQRIISRRVLTPKGDGEGGGGGDATARRPPRLPAAGVLAGVGRDRRSGRATREVTLPESLTTYRIMAVAGDARVAVRIGRRRDQGHQTGHAARGVPAVPDAWRSRLVRRRRHQHARDRRHAPR